MSEKKPEFSIVNGRELLKAKYPEQLFYIVGILPILGKLLLVGAAKAGKSNLVFQMALALAAGWCEWLGLKFGPPAKVLLLQAEMPDQVVQRRLKALLDTWPGEIDKDRALNNFHYHQRSDVFPDLSPVSREATNQLILEFEPEILILDPFVSIFPGIDENSQRDVSAILRYLDGFIEAIGCAIILVHHEGKESRNRGPRGSSVFQGWADTILTLKEGK